MDCIVGAALVPGAVTSRFRAAGRRGHPAPVPFLTVACERRAPGIASPWPFNDYGRFLPERTAAASLRDRLPHPAVVTVTRATRSIGEGGAAESATQLPFASAPGSDAPCPLVEALSASQRDPNQEEFLSIVVDEIP